MAKRKTNKTKTKERDLEVGRLMQNKPKEIKRQNPLPIKTFLEEQSSTKSWKGKTTSPNIVFPNTQSFYSSFNSPRPSAKLGFINNGRPRILKKLARSNRSDQRGKRGTLKTANRTESGTSRKDQREVNICFQTRNPARQVDWDTEDVEESGPVPQMCQLKENQFKLNETPSFKKKTESSQDSKSLSSIQLDSDKCGSQFFSFEIGCEIRFDLIINKKPSKPVPKNCQIRNQKTNELS